MTDIIASVAQMMLSFFLIALAIGIVISVFNFFKRRQNMKNQEPDLYDEVKHKKNEITGTVIAIFPMLSSRTRTRKMYLDVRSDNRIYYQTPASNWEVTKKNDNNE